MNLFLNCLFNYAQLDKEGSQQCLPNKVTLSTFAGNLSALLLKKKTRNRKNTNQNKQPNPPNQEQKYQKPVPGMLSDRA